MYLKKITLSVLLLFSLAFNTGLKAQTGAAWLEIEPSAREASLAGVSAASAYDAAATYWNPALIGHRGNAVQVMHTENFDGSAVQYISGSFNGAPVNLPRFGAGLSIFHVGTSDLELRDRPTTDPIGTFDAERLSLSGGISYELSSKGMRVGATGRYLSDKIYYYPSSGWAVDFGVYKQNLGMKHLNLGATVRNIGSMSAHNEEVYDLPLTSTIGVNYRFVGFPAVSPAVMMDAVYVKGHNFSLRAAAETWFSDLIALRAGYRTGYDARNFSMGFGLRWQVWQIDYAYTPFEYDLGNVQRFSLGVSW